MYNAITIGEGGFLAYNVRKTFKDVEQESSCHGYD